MFYIISSRKNWSTKAKCTQQQSTQPIINFLERTQPITPPGLPERHIILKRKSHQFLQTALQFLGGQFVISFSLKLKHYRSYLFSHKVTYFASHLVFIRDLYRTANSSFRIRILICQSEVWIRGSGSGSRSVSKVSEYYLQNSAYAWVKKGEVRLDIFFDSPPLPLLLYSTQEVFQLIDEPGYTQCSGLVRNNNFGHGINYKCLLNFLLPGLPASFSTFIDPTQRFCSQLCGDVWLCVCGLGGGGS